VDKVKRGSSFARLSLVDGYLDPPSSDATLLDDVSLIFEAPNSREGRFEITGWLQDGSWGVPER